MPNQHKKRGPSGAIMLCGIIMIIGLMITAAGAMLPLAGVNIPALSMTSGGNTGGGGGTNVAYTVTFHVISERQGVSGIPVTLGGHTQTTDSAGVALFALPSGTYHFTLSVTGYRTVMGTVIVSGANTGYTATLIPTPSTAAVSFYVFDSSLQQPIGGATVSDGVTSVVTSSVGFAVFSEAIGQQFSYTVTANGYSQYSGSNTPTASEQINVAMTSNGGSKIPTTATVAFAATQSGSAVYAILSGNSLVSGKTTPCSVAMTAGSYSITAAYGDQAQTLHVTVVAGQDQAVNFVIPYQAPPVNNTQPPANGTLIINATVNGNPANGSQVTINVGGNSYDAPVQLNLAPGQYSINATFGSQSQTQTVTVTAGQTTNANFAFTGQVTPPLKAAPNIFNAVTVSGISLTIMGLLGMILVAAVGGRKQ